MGRPTAAQLEAATGRRVRDVIAQDLALLFCGINPGRWTAAVGHHFAHPNNRFWKVLYGAGITPEPLVAAQQEQLLGLGIGITNLVPRTTATAAELTRPELEAGATALTRKVRRRRPRVVAIVGLGAYRQAFHRPKATMGEQSEGIATARLWVLPNPSGLQASYQMEDLVRAYREAYREAARAAGIGLESAPPTPRRPRSSGGLG